MSTFRHTISVAALLASAALVTACQSEKDRSEKKTSSVKATEEAAPSKVERTPAPTESPSVIERIFSPTSKPATPQRSIASTKSKHAKPTTHAKPTKNGKAKAHADAKMATKNAKPSDSKKSDYTSYGSGAEGAGITDPSDTAQTVKGTTRSVKK